MLLITGSPDICLSHQDGSTALRIGEVTVVSGKAIKKKAVTSQSGAAAVEFALALVALFIFFAIYSQCVQLILEHGRLAFTGFVTARTFDVRGKIPAWKTGHAMDLEASIIFDSKSPMVDLSKPILIPKPMRPVFTNGYPNYILTHSSPLFDEQALLKRIRGDN
ncbi:MAG: hypothetical protein V1793_19575 [Pseudomonadota bacterium]